MCGIVAYVGAQSAPTIILDGLRRLEYRGYDSAGLAVLEHNGRVQVRRDKGKLENLLRLYAAEPCEGHIGIGHTRWATHGAPSQRNSHPHTSMGGRVVVVQNGIVENYLALKEELSAEGVAFTSDTDTEIIAQLAERYLDSGLSFVEAARATLGRLAGSNAVVLLDTQDDSQLICARLGNAGGITLGVGDGEMFVASDIPAILSHTRRVVFLESRQMAVVRADGYAVQWLSGAPVSAEEVAIPWDPVSAAKGEYRHFMQKEIFDQPRALVDTLGGRVDFETGAVSLPEMNLSTELAQRLDKIIIVACGTSYYAGLLGKQFIESMARIPVEAAYASEFRYADPIVDENTAVLAITQSGETADTLAALDEARRRGATLWSIVNAIGSQAMRTVDGYIAMHAGPEIGVASTKAFTTSLVDLYLLGIALGRLRGTLSEPEGRARALALTQLPDLAGQVLDRDDEFEALAHHFHKASDFLFIGRGVNYPIALEGALKLKEISYIHAEGYPAGEMKHGPIALIDETLPIVALVTQDRLYDKMVSQIQQSKARGGIVIAVATEGDTAIHAEADHVITVPAASELLQPILNVIPLQLLAYHIAVWRGCDVDQPRNLAKSVTVE